jgi:hypothetical protein
VHRARMRDAAYALRTRPADYARGVLDSAVEMFGPTTEWHPADRRGGSPHAGHRRVLGAYEAIYNRAVHTLPAAPVGVYVLLPFTVLWALARAHALVRAGHLASGPAPRHGVARGALLFFCLLQIAFVVAASSALTTGEMARYRFQVEPLIWLVTASSVVDLAGRGRATITRRERASRSRRPAFPGPRP